MEEGRERGRGESREKSGGKKSVGENKKKRGWEKEKREEHGDEEEESLETPKNPSGCVFFRGRHIGLDWIDEIEIPCGVVMELESDMDEEEEEEWGGNGEKGRFKKRVRIEKEEKVQRYWLRERNELYTRILNSLFRLFREREDLILGE